MIHSLSFQPLTLDLLQALKQGSPLEMTKSKKVGCRTTFSNSLLRQLQIAPSPGKKLPPPKKLIAKPNKPLRRIDIDGKLWIFRFLARKQLDK